MKIKIISQVIHHSPEKSSFAYWFSHWCSYQTTAISLGVWRWRHLLHDIEKPFLRLFFPYNKVRDLHRKNNKHHLEHQNPNYLDMIIDWECSQTKGCDAVGAHDYYKKVERSGKYSVDKLREALLVIKELKLDY